MSSDSKKMSETPAVLCVLLAGFLWGIIGVFIKKLTALGFSSFQITMLRCLTTALCVFIYLLLKDRQQLKINIKDAGWFLLNGIASIFLFYNAYQMSITMVAMSTAVVLLYTAPAFVLIISVIFFHEKLTVKSTISVVFCVVGSALVSGITNGFSGSPLGIALGLLSGLGYALYSIFSVVILKKYSPMTNLLYTFLIAGAAAFITGDGAGAIRLTFSSGEAFIWVLLACLLTGFISYSAYTWALTRIAASKASVIATIEPIVAILVGTLVYHEELTAAGVIGIILVLGAIIIRQGKSS